MPRLIALVLCAAQFGATTVCAAQTAAQPATQTPSAAPVPTQIASAKTVFLSNLGADSNFPIDSTSAYNAIYNDLQVWGQYQLVGSPEEADLILQLHDLSTYTTYTGNHGSTYTIDNPSFQLTIVDAKSNVTLWTISSPVYLAGSKQVLARWQAISETNLVSRLKVLTGQPLSATETADLTDVPKTHTKALVFGIVGGFVAISVGGFLIAHHEFENDLNNQKASQDAFCAAHGIPPSECLGG
jgi:hypothetical protein